MQSEFFKNNILTDNIQIGILAVELNHSMHILYANNFFYRIFGYTKKEALEKNKTEFKDYIDLNNWNNFKNKAARYYDSKSKFYFEMYIKNNDNKDMHIIIDSIFIKSENHIVMECVIIDNTKNKKEFFNSMLSQFNIVWEYDIENNLITCYKNFNEKKINIISEKNITPENIVKEGYIHSESKYDFLNVYREIKNGKSKIDCIICVRENNSNNNFYCAKLVCTSVFDENNSPKKAICTLNKIENIKKRVRSNYEKEYKNLIECNTIFEYEVNISQNKLIGENKLYLDLINLKSSDSYMKLINTIKFKIHDQNQKYNFEKIFDRKNLLIEFQNGKKEVSYDYIQLNFDNILKWVCTTIYMIKESVNNNNNICGFIYIKDIDEKKKKEISLREKAEKDQLTGLYNCNSFREKVNNIINESKDIYAFFMIDIDNFKKVNDTFGHIYGDAVLSETARKVVNNIYEGDIAGRMGGDEISIFIRMNSEEDIIKKAEKICKSVYTTYYSEKQNCIVSCSIGISFYPKHGIKFDDLYKRADIALYNKKNNGKNGFIIFDNNMSMDINKVTEIERDYGKNFSDNIVEYIFRILYKSNNLNFAISSVLELIAKRFGLSHSYISEYDEKEKLYKMTFEWYDKKIKRKKYYIENIEKNELEKFLVYFDRLEDLYILNIDKSSESVYEYLKKMNLKMIILSNIDIYKGIKGIVGIIIYNEECELSSNEIYDLKTCSDMIGIFLNSKRSEQKREEYTASLKTVFDNLNCYTYVVHPYTRELIFMNKKSKSIMENVSLGDKCYDVFSDFGKPCSNCPIDRLIENGVTNYSAEIFNKALNAWVESTANWIEWFDGNKYCLVNCININQYKKAELEIKKAKHELDSLINTISGGVAKFDLNDNFRILFASEGYYRLRGYNKSEIDFKNEIDFVIEEDKNIILSKKEEIIKSNNPVSIEYRVRKKDNKIAWNIMYCSKAEKIKNKLIIQSVIIDTTIEKNIEQRLIRLTNGIPGGIAHVKADEEFTVEYANDGFYKLIGYSVEEFNGININSKYLNLIYPEDQQMVVDKVKKFILSPKKYNTLIHRILKKDGIIIWVSVSATYIDYKNDCKIDLECIFSDVTETVNNEKQMMLNEERYRILTEQTQDSVFDWDMETGEVYYSPVFEKKFGCKVPHDDVTRFLKDSDLIYEEDKTILFNIMASIRNGLPYGEVEYRIKDKYSKYIWCKVKIVSIFDNYKKPYRAVGIITDIDNERKEKLMLKEKAQKDLLTGLYNKITSQEIIIKCIEKNNDKKYALFIIDVDNFKNVNDSLGHLIGDVILKNIAECIKKQFSDGEVVGRIGGDEFIVFIENYSDKNEIIQKVRELINMIRCSDYNETNKRYISISVGIAFYPQNGKTFQQLYQNADKALYNSKRKGKDCCCIYNEYE